MHFIITQDYPIKASNCKRIRYAKNRDVIIVGLLLFIVGQAVGRFRWTTIFFAILADLTLPGPGTSDILYVLEGMMYGYLERCEVWKMRQ
jgi:hypothetical protein